VFSLVPLVILSVLAAVLVTQSSATLAYSYFQSPESPVSTPMPPAGAPTQEVPQPPGESPVAPPGETPGEVPAPPVVPEASPSEGAPPEEGLPAGEGMEEPPTGDEAPPSAEGRSLSVLIDTFVVGLSSLWLCCGGVLLVVFVLVMIAAFLLRVT
jgi:hypothetical protein